MSYCFYKHFRKNNVMFFLHCIKYNFNVFTLGNIKAFATIGILFNVLNGRCQHKMNGYSKKIIKQIKAPQLNKNRHLQQQILCTCTPSYHIHFFFVFNKGTLRVYYFLYLMKLCKSIICKTVYRSV